MLRSLDVEYQIIYSLRSCVTVIDHFHLAISEFDKKSVRLQTIVHIRETECREEYDLAEMYSDFNLHGSFTFV